MARKKDLVFIGGTGEQVVTKFEKHIKRKARFLKQDGITHSEALERAATSLGLRNFHHLQMIKTKVRRLRESSFKQTSQNPAIFDDSKDYYVFLADCCLTVFEKKYLDDDMPRPRGLIPLLTEFSGYSLDIPKTELRVASPIHPRAVFQWADAMELNVHVINNSIDGLAWLFKWGEVALVSADVMRDLGIFSKFLKPRALSSISPIQTYYQENRLS